MILSILLALFFGLSVSGTIGYLFPAGEMLTALSVFSSIIIAVLYGFGGIMPVIVMTVTMLVSGFVFAGWGIPAYLFLIGFLPGIVMVYGSKRGIKFFAQLRNAMIAQLFAFVILLFAMRMITGQDFAAFLRTIWDQMIELMPADVKDTFADFLNQLINQQNAKENIISTSDMLEFFSEAMEQSLVVMTPAAVVLYSVLNPSVGVLWMNWLRVRHQEENVKYVPLSGWRLSKQVTLGLIIVYIAVLIIGKRMPEAGASAQIIVLAAIIYAGCIQACASILSRFRLLGVSLGKRICFLILIAIISFVYFPLYGIMSALFGSQGLFMPKIRIQNAGHNNQKPEEKQKEDNQTEDNQTKEQNEDNNSDKED